MADPADIAARLDRAIQHKIVGEYDAAVTLLQSVLAELPNHADAHHELGLVYVFTGLFDESIVELERAVSLVPNSIKYMIDLGKTLTMLGEYEKAIPVFRRVLTFDPFNDEALKNLDFIDPQ